MIKRDVFADCVVPGDFAFNLPWRSRTVDADAFGLIVAVIIIDPYNFGITLVSKMGLVSWSVSKYFVVQVMR